MPLLSTTDSSNIAADYLENSVKMLVTELDNWMSACDNLSVNAHTFLLNFYQQRLLVVRDRWTIYRGTGGVEATIRARWPGKWASDAIVTTLLLDINNGMTTLATYIATNVEASLINGSGYVEIIKFVSNAPSYRIITNSGQLTALKAQLLILKNLIIG